MQGGQAQAGGTKTGGNSATTEGGNQTMTLDEWKKYLMANPQYGFSKTQGGRDMGEQMASAILNEFGKENTDGGSPTLRSVQPVVRLRREHGEWLMDEPTSAQQRFTTRVITLGGTVTQAQVAAALASGPESSIGGGFGEPQSEELSRWERVLAEGLFQFEPGTWTGKRGGKNGLPSSVGAATWEQQVQGSLTATQGNNFGAWGPDLVANSGDPNSSSNSAYGYTGAPQPGSRVGNIIAATSATWGAGFTPGTTNISGMTADQWSSLYAASQVLGGTAYLEAANAANQAAERHGHRSRRSRRQCAELFGRLGDRDHPRLRHPDRDRPTSRRSRHHPRHAERVRLHERPVEPVDAVGVGRDPRRHRCHPGGHRPPDTGHHGLPGLRAAVPRLRGGQRPAHIPGPERLERQGLRGLPDPSDTAGPAVFACRQDSSTRTTSARWSGTTAPWAMS